MKEKERQNKRVGGGSSCDGKFKNLSTRCRTTRGNFIISAARARGKEELAT